MAVPKGGYGTRLHSDLIEAVENPLEIASFQGEVEELIRRKVDLNAKDPRGRQLLPVLFSLHFFHNHRLSRKGSLRHHQHTPQDGDAYRS